MVANLSTTNVSNNLFYHLDRLGLSDSLRVEVTGSVLMMEGHGRTKFYNLHSAEWILSGITPDEMQSVLLYEFLDQFRFCCTHPERGECSEEELGWVNDSLELLGLDDVVAYFDRGRIHLLLGTYVLDEYNPENFIKHVRRQVLLSGMYRAHCPFRIWSLLECAEV